MPGMVAVLSPYAEQKVLLKRTEDDVYQHIQEFVVADCDGEVIGLAALHIYGSNLAEIRSLAVHEVYKGKQVGRMLVEACETMAIELHVALIFALTYVQDFFARMDYQQVPKESLPHKIWTVCVHCDKFSECDEVAVQKRLSDDVIKPMHLIPIYEECIIESFD